MHAQARRRRRAPCANSTLAASPNEPVALETPEVDALDEQRSRLTGQSPHPPIIAHAPESQG
jgi:hypothetical protein